MELGIYLLSDWSEQRLPASDSKNYYYLGIYLAFVTIEYISAYSRQVVCFFVLIQCRIYGTSLSTL